MATRSRKSSKNRATGKRSQQRDSQKISPSRRPWILSLWSRSSRTDRSPDSDQDAPDSVDPRRSALQREVWGIALLFFALFLGGSLVAEGIAALRGADFRSSFGWAGSLLAVPLVSFFGWPAAALLPIAAAAHALRVFGRLGPRTDRLWMAFLLGLVVLLPIGIGLVRSEEHTSELQSLTNLVCR